MYDIDMTSSLPSGSTKRWAWDLCRWPRRGPSADGKDGRDALNEAVSNFFKHAAVARTLLFAWATNSLNLVWRGKSGNRIIRWRELAGSSTYPKAYTMKGLRVAHRSSRGITPTLPLIDGDNEDIEMTPVMLSNEVLGTNKAERDVERTERKANGNKHGKEKKSSGRGFDEIMASVFIERKKLTDKKVTMPIYYCLGCDHPVRNNAKTRNASHMLGCKALQRDFPATWTKFKNSLGPSSEAVAAGTAPAPPLRLKKRKVEDPADGRSPIPGITTELPQSESSQEAAPTQHTLASSWGESSITATRQSVIDYLLLRLIVCCSLAFALLDNGCPSYSVPDRSSFITYNLVTEAENAMAQLKILLESFFHLTLSFDGWSSARNDEIYTVHVTTPSRMSYMVAGIILTGLSTTSDIIFENLKAASFQLHPHHNILLLYAALNLLAKEIMVGSKKFPKVHGFTEIMKIISAITTFFSHSNYGKKHLRDKLQDQEDKRGLVSFGATRFSTFANQSSSTKPLQKYFMADSPDQLQFRLHLYMLLKPIARGLKTLESSMVTCSTSGLVSRSDSKRSLVIQIVNVRADDPIAKYHQETFDCFNRRFAIFMNDCTPGMFILSYLLDPGTNIQSPFTILLTNNFREQKGDAAEGDLLVKQLISYMYREAPFDQPCTDLDFRLSWWKSLAKDSNANVLARLGIKFFSVAPSEMPDERTASKLTAMSTAKRNNLGGSNLVRLAQLNQYWRYGFGSLEIKRHCQKVRLELPTANRKPSDPIVTGIPTLRDLLNADSVDNQPVDEQALFNHPDPYGINDMEVMEEGEDETDTAAPPLVTRRAGLPTLLPDEYREMYGDAEPA
ncbi:hypothetical protein B0H10DRAFT_1960891 [Mycena sp. CBHHK59/15]|nr:hypothetical protein B0H10DRAFT_1960891 [Mycena sp. CBHHK59/15]